MIEKQDFILGDPVRTQNFRFDFVLGEPFTIIGEGETWNRTQSESEGMTDAIVVQQQIARTIADLLGISDTVSSIVSRLAATDNIGVAKRAMKQKAIWWWAYSGLGEFGKSIYNPPVEIDCRWEDVVEEFINPNGDREASRSKLIVDRDMKVKDKLKLGKLDSTIMDDPNDNEDVWEALQFMKTPDFRGRKYLREVYL